MALIPCPECSKEISDKAATCPNCGSPTEAWEAQKKAEQKARISNRANTTLMSCPECGKEVSEMATICRNCGKLMSAGYWRLYHKRYLAIGLGILLMILAVILGWTGWTVLERSEASLLFAIGLATFIVGQLTLTHP